MVFFSTISLIFVEKVESMTNLECFGLERQVQHQLFVPFIFDFL